MEDESSEQRGGGSRALTVVLIVLAVLCGGGGLGVVVCLGSVVTINRNLAETFEDVAEQIRQDEEAP